MGQTSQNPPQPTTPLRGRHWIALMGLAQLVLFGITMQDRKIPPLGNLGMMLCVPIMMVAMSIRQRGEPE